MRINTNVMSYVAYNATVKSSSQLAKASEKLATGLRINSAADDAAGLAISEKMTAQIRGLDQATRNAQDGMSLLQTAEGALNEIHSMLQRMRELAIQAANDVLTAEDRDYIQLEVNELTRQITDIANQTQFNKKKLLNGDSAILWSTSTSDIRVLVGGTLLKKDIFGQTVNAEGNYKITFETIQAGNEQVQKSNIFYLKHGTTDTNAAIDGSSGVTGFDALNMVEGVWRVETLGEPFGGVHYYNGDYNSILPSDVGATLDPSGVSDLAPGEYAIQLSDNVPMMATFDTTQVDDIYQSTRTNASNVDISGVDAFNAAFEATGGTGSGNSNTSLIQSDIISASLVPVFGDIKTVNTNMNVYTYYEVQSIPTRDFVGGVLEVSIDYSAPIKIYLDGIDDGTNNLVTLEDAVSNINAQLSAAGIARLTATADYNEVEGRIEFTTTYLSEVVRITQTVRVTYDVGLISGTITIDNDPDPSYPSTGYSNYVQAKDAFDLLIAWEGNDANGNAIVQGSKTVKVYEGYDNEALLNSPSGPSSLVGTPLYNLYQNFILNGATTTSNFKNGDSWMMFTNAAPVSGGDSLEVELWDEQGWGTEHQIAVKYYFNDGVLDAAATTDINQMAWAGGGNGNQYENLQHHIDIGDNEIGTGSVSFSYGERSNGGDYDEWAMGGSRDTMPYYAQAYYGEQTTYHIDSGASIGSVIWDVQVNKMNDINASLLFTYNGSGFDVAVKGYNRDGSPLPGSAGPVNASGAQTIAGIDFTSINFNTAGLTAGDKFVINVAAAAKLDNAGSLTSNENISIYADLARSGGTGWDSVSQYRFVNGAAQNGNYEGFIIDKLTGAIKSGVLQLDITGLDSNSGVGTPGSPEAGLADSEAFWILAQVNNQGSLVPGAGGLVTSVYIKDLEKDATKDVIDYIPEIKYAEVKGVQGEDTKSSAGPHNDYNASVIFDFLGFVEDDPAKARFRIQAHVMDIYGNYAYIEDEERDLIIGQNAIGGQFVIFSAASAAPDYCWQDTLPNFTGLYFDSFELAGAWEAGDRFTLSLIASGAAGGGAKDSDGIDQTMDEVTFISDMRGTAQPHSFRFNDGVLNNGTTDFHIYQLANNTYREEDSVHFADDQVMDGTVSLGIGSLTTAPNAVEFTSTFMKGIDAGVAHYYSRPEDIKQFWNANGVFLLENQPEALTVKLGDKETTIYIDSNVELGKLARRMSEQIWLNLIQGQGDITKDSIDESDLDDRDKDEIVQFVNSVPGQSTNEAVFGTLVAHSVIPGVNYKLEFFGSEELLKALAFREIMAARDTVFKMDVTDAHSGRPVGASRNVIAGQDIYDVVAPGINLAADAAIGINSVRYEDAAGVFKTNLSAVAGVTFDRYVHLADNALVLQIGANQGEDTVLVLGDVTAKALGVHNLEVRNRESAARAVTRIDNAIRKVSKQRAIIGAQVNRLEHAVNAITVASTNLSDSRSKIKDVDYANEMLNYAKLNILQRAGFFMQTQANQVTNNILTLMR